MSTIKTQFPLLQPGHNITVKTVNGSFTGIYKQTLRYLELLKLHYEWVEIEREPGKHQQIPHINIKSITINGLSN